MKKLDLMQKNGVYAKSNALETTNFALEDSSVYVIGVEGKMIGCWREKI